MKPERNNSPKQLQPSTIDAWLMLFVVSGLYVLSQRIIYANRRCWNVSGKSYGMLVILINRL
jgi:hypothetical protein